MKIEKGGEYNEETNRKRSRDEPQNRKGPKREFYQRLHTGIPSVGTQEEGGEHHGVQEVPVIKETSEVRRHL